MSDGVGKEPMPEEHGTTGAAGAAAPRDAGPRREAGGPGEAGTSQGGETPSHGAPWWSEPHSGAGQWSGHGAGAESAGHDYRTQGPGYGHGAYGSQGPGYGQGAYGAQGPGYGQGAYAPGQHWGAAQGSGGGWGWGGHGGWGGPPPSGGPERRHGGSRKALAAGAAGLLTLAALAVGVGIGYDVWSGGTTPAASFTPHTTTGFTRSHSTTNVTSATSATSSGKITSATGSPSDLTAIAKKVEPGIADINTVLGYETEEAAGTGMVLTPTGKVLTNNHVIEGSTSISVTDLGNGKTYKATVVGYDKTQDVAVIQLKNASGLTTVKTGNSSTVKDGEPVVGIGNAGGTGGTPSVAGGSVTALDQSITASDEGTLGTTVEHLTGLIESDCDIQPGDSGGPLVNKTGVVLGMDTAASAAEGYSFSGASTGQGYSIPINTALSVAKTIIAGKASSSVHIGGTGFLGVYVRTSTSSNGHSGNGYGYPGLTTTPGTTTTTATQGAFVTGVISGTPAQSAGLAKGDVITSVAGTSVSSASAVTKIMMQYHPGQKVKVNWTTPTGSTHSATLTLASGPAD